jgi:hypothetical protein
MYKFIKFPLFKTFNLIWISLLAMGVTIPLLKAQEISSSAVNFKQSTSSGEFSNCMIELDYMFSDRRLKKKMSALYGGISLALSKKNDLYWFIKIVTSENMEILPINASGLSTPEKSFKARQIPCDDQRQFCGAIVGLDGVLEIFKALNEDRLVLWFNHKPGGFDERLPISFLRSFKSKGQRHQQCVNSVLKKAMIKYK